MNDNNVPPPLIKCSYHSSETVGSSSSLSAGEEQRIGSATSNISRFDADMIPPGGFPQCLKPLGKPERSKSTSTSLSIHGEDITLNSAIFVLQEEEEQDPQEPTEGTAKGAAPAAAAAAHDDDDPLECMGISRFNLCLWPEGKEMEQYNLTHPDARGNNFSSKYCNADHRFTVGSTKVILSNFGSVIHPADADDMKQFIQGLVQLAAEWHANKEGGNDEGGGEEKEGQQAAKAAKARAYEFHDFRIMNPRKKEYRWQQVRARMRKTTDNLIICDGAFLDITEAKEREEELQKKTMELQREIGHHNSTQGALQEVMEELRELRTTNKKTMTFSSSAERCRCKEEEKSLQSSSGNNNPRDIMMPNSLANMQHIFDDVASAVSLIEAAEFPQKKWTKTILLSLLENLEGVDCPDDDVSEISFSKRENLGGW